MIENARLNRPGRRTGDAASRHRPGLGRPAPPAARCRTAVRHSPISPPQRSGPPHRRRLLRFRRTGRRRDRHRAGRRVGQGRRRRPDHVGGAGVAADHLVRGRRATAAPRRAHERVRLPVDAGEQVRDLLLRAARRGGAELRYVNAGHNPPYSPAAAGIDRRLGVPEIEELTVGGTVVGMFPEMVYEEATVELRAGDVLLAFTDGVPEAHNPEDEEFGEERLQELLRRRPRTCRPTGSARGLSAGDDRLDSRRGAVRRSHLRRDEGSLTTAEGSIQRQEPRVGLEPHAFAVEFTVPYPPPAAALRTARRCRTTPRNSFVPSGSVRSRPLARLEPSLAW